MRGVVRQHVGLTTFVLSAIALALVFGSVFQAVPAGPLPRSGFLLGLIPHLNAVISLAAIGTIATGVLAIRQDQVERHRRSMLASTGLFATFLLLYLYKILLEGPTIFTGPAVVEQFVFLPVLVIHTLLAVIAVPLVIYVLLLAGTHTVAEMPSTPHPRVGRLAAALWLVSFTLGVLVYALLYLVY